MTVMTREEIVEYLVMRMVEQEITANPGTLYADDLKSHLWLLAGERKPDYSKASAAGDVCPDDSELTFRGTGSDRVAVLPSPGFINQPTKREMGVDAPDFGNPMGHTTHIGEPYYKLDVEQPCPTCGCRLHHLAGHSAHKSNTCMHCGTNHPRTNCPALYKNGKP